MRDYVYLWRDADGSLVASGIEFRDLAPSLKTATGLFLLEHAFAGAVSRHGSLDFVPASDLSSLVEDDTYSYGNFIWADARTTGASAPVVTDADLAALLFFRHTSRPLRRVCVPSIGNRFLAFHHDDGWFLRLYAEEWRDIEAAISPALSNLISPASATGMLGDVARARCAFWITATSVEEVAATTDIDVLLNARAAP